MGGYLTEGVFYRVDIHLLPRKSRMSKEAGGGRRKRKSPRPTIVSASTSSIFRPETSRMSADAYGSCGRIIRKKRRRPPKWQKIWRDGHIISSVIFRMLSSAQFLTECFNYAHIPAIRAMASKPYVDDSIPDLGHFGIFASGFSACR